MQKLYDQAKLDLESHKQELVTRKQDARSRAERLERELERERNRESLAEAELDGLVMEERLLRSETRMLQEKRRALYRDE